MDACDTEIENKLGNILKSIWLRKHLNIDVRMDILIILMFVVREFCTITP